jgi:hypothetical protein
MPVAPSGPMRRINLPPASHLQHGENPYFSTLGGLASRDLTFRFRDRESSREFGARADPKLAIRAGEVLLDSFRRNEQLGRGFRVGRARRNNARDLQFLRGQLQFSGRGRSSLTLPASLRHGGPGLRTGSLKHG